MTRGLVLVDRAVACATGPPSNRPRGRAGTRRRGAKPPRRARRQGSPGRARSRGGRARSTRRLGTDLVAVRLRLTLRAGLVGHQRATRSVSSSGRIVGHDIARRCMQRSSPCPHGALQATASLRRRPPACRSASAMPMAPRRRAGGGNCEGARGVMLAQRAARGPLESSHPDYEQERAKETGTPRRVVGAGTTASLRPAQPWRPGRRCVSRRARWSAGGCATKESFAAPGSPNFHSNFHGIIHMGPRLPRPRARALRSPATSGPRTSSPMSSRTARRSSGRAPRRTVRRVTASRNATPRRCASWR